MRLSHARNAIDARFDDPNLVSCAGLVAVMSLADRCGLGRCSPSRLLIAAAGGANAAAKILAIIAGMVCGADSIDDLDLLRHGGMGRLFDGVRAPSTLGMFLRVFTGGRGAGGRVQVQVCSRQRAKRRRSMTGSRRVTAAASGSAGTAMAAVRSISRRSPAEPNRDRRSEPAGWPRPRG